MRKYLIAGNWKMNAGPKEGKELAAELSAKWGDHSFKVDVLVCPPYLSIPAVVGELSGTEIKTGTQNHYPEDNGAFTGEISTSMIKEAGCSYAIAGHSERREYFQESDEFIAKKVKKALDDGIKPILCVGEKLDQRKSGNHKKVVQEQLNAVLDHLNPQHASDFVVAYEPVWAIGTGETASPEQAQEMHAYIRSLISEKWTEEKSANVQILYGGSMKPANAEELLSQPDVDGGLIGGASLKAGSFSEIIEIAESLSK
jgi:triosephosphate isomerase